MTKVVFIAFAKEDERIRDLIKGQSLHVRTQFAYVDMSVKIPYDIGWKERVRTRIRRSDGVIALVSKNSPQATGQIWEVECAVQEGKPVYGLWIYKGDRTVPRFMAGKNISVWTWDGLAKIIDSL